MAPSSTNMTVANLMKEISKQKRRVKKLEVAVRDFWSKDERYDAYLSYERMQSYNEMNYDHLLDDMKMEVEILKELVGELQHLRALPSVHRQLQEFFAARKN